MTTLTMQLPFDGFYHSDSDYQLDSGMEMDFESIDTSKLTFDPSDLSAEVNWKAVYTDFAKLYVEKFQEYLEYEDCPIVFTFADLDSPREYNFGTDRIFVTLSLEEAEKIKAGVTPEAFAQVVKEKFTAYDGFVPHYSNNPDEWTKPLQEWDHNELYALFTAFLKSKELYDSYLEEVLDRTREQGMWLALEHLSEKGNAWYDEVTALLNS